VDIQTVKLAIPNALKTDSFFRLEALYVKTKRIYHENEQIIIQFWNRELASKANISIDESLEIKERYQKLLGALNQQKEKEIHAIVQAMNNLCAVLI